LQSEQGSNTSLEHFDLYPSAAKRHRFGLLERGKISLRATSVDMPRVTESSSVDSVLLGCDAVSSCV